jgi:hypothetical protein
MVLSNPLGKPMLSSFVIRLKAILRVAFKISYIEALFR